MKLAWTTATETNNFGFDVERRCTNGAWKKIGFLQGAGTSNQQHVYSYTDKTPMAGSVLYRLKQIDRDGAFTYSKECAAAVARTGQGPAQLLGNYPNPFNPQTIIKFQLFQPGMVTVKIFNTIGQEVATLVNGQMQEGEYEVPFNGTNLASGMYITQLTAGGAVAMHKILLTK